MVISPRGGDSLSRWRFFIARQNKSSCWIWGGALTHNGYGRFKVGGKTVLAHRFGYERLVGEITKATLDHLCDTPACVNPAHLQLASVRENVLRGRGVTGINHRKTSCVRGHALSGENLLVTRQGTKRICRICKRDGERRRRKTDMYRVKHALYERKRRQK